MSTCEHYIFKKGSQYPQLPDTPLLVCTLRSPIHLHLRTSEQRRPQEQHWWDCAMLVPAHGEPQEPLRPSFPSWLSPEEGQGSLWVDFQEVGTPTANRVHQKLTSTSAPLCSAGPRSVTCCPYLSLRVVVEAGVEKCRHQWHVEDGGFAGVLPEDLCLSC